jgi:hypothetical protein
MSGLYGIWVKGDEIEYAKSFLTLKTANQIAQMPNCLLSKGKSLILRNYFNISKTIRKSTF